MSFAVFGASMDMCLKTARKRVKKVKGIGQHAVTLTQSEWELEVREYANDLFQKYEQGKRKPIKVSADLTTPSACREFIELAKKTEVCTTLHIYQRQPDGKRINPKTKEPIMKFQPWVGAA